MTKEQKKQYFIDTIKLNKEDLILSESKNKLNKAIEALVNHVFENKKSATLITVHYDEYTTYSLEKVKDYYFILKQVRFNDLSEPVAEIVDFRTELKQQEIDRLDPDNYEDSLLELAIELDQEQGRFGI